MLISRVPAVAVPRRSPQNRPHRTGRRSTTTSSRFLAGLILVASAVSPATVLADPILYGLYPSGYGQVPGDRDSHWTVEAVAASGTYQPGYPTQASGTAITTTPYPAYVLQTDIPPEFIGGSANAGIYGARWIGLQNSAKAIVGGTASASSGPVYSNSYVLSINFGATESGNAAFDLWAASDNAVAFFVGGSITTSTNVVNAQGTWTGTNETNYATIFGTSAIGSDFPTIVGGTQIDIMRRGFGALRRFVGNAPVVAGTANTLYAVVYDYGNKTGFIFSPVPEPSAWVLAAIACGCIAVGSLRRGRKARGTETSPLVAKNAGGGDARSDRCESV